MNVNHHIHFPFSIFNYACLLTLAWINDKCNIDK